MALTLLSLEEHVNASMPVSKYASMQLDKYASMQVCQYAGVQVSKYASIQACRHPRLSTQSETITQTLTQWSKAKGHGSF